MTKKEKECKDMSDVCELAHERTVRECRYGRKGNQIQVNCNSEMLCGDSGQDHEDESGTHYTQEAQDIFNDYYDLICEKTGI